MSTESSFAMQDVALIAVDWGSSSLRIALLNVTGKILDVIFSDSGILNINGQSFQDVFDSSLKKFGYIPSDIPCVMFGMVGSRSGWHDIPYVQAPCDLFKLSNGCKLVEQSSGRRFLFCPGVMQELAEGVDVMRGEEVQVFGTPQDNDSKLFVLPGTHCKWVSLSKSMGIEHFKTYMTGDIYSALSKHTVLKFSTNGDRITNRIADSKSFLEGLDVGFRCVDLSDVLFFVRTRSLFEDNDQYCGEDYLSGILIGNEFRSAAKLFPRAKETGVVLLGSSELQKRYGLAAKRFGFEVTVGDPFCGFVGAWRVALNTGLI
jgi:2-dehydro-3-deoxygalactonokinase